MRDRRTLIKEDLLGVGDGSSRVRGVVRNKTYNSE